VQVTETYAAAGAAPTRKSQTLYLGGFEIYSRFAADGTTPTLVRDSVHILDGSKTVAIVENQTKGEVASEPLMRYQFTNHLGSVSLELDDTAAIISYEEYTPYGSSSYFAVGSKVEALKRYRYTGKERDDEETGFYYYGARYYAHWLGRWTSSDPAGFADGLNPFVYAKSNPIKLVDATGMDSSTPPNFQLQMPPPPPGLGSRVGSNIQLMPPLPVPPSSTNTQNQDFKLTMPSPPPGLGPRVGSNIQLMPPLPVPPSSINTQNQDFKLTMPPPPPGLGPPVGSNIQLMAPLPIPSSNFKEQSRISPPLDLFPKQLPQQKPSPLLPPAQALPLAPPLAPSPNPFRSANGTEIKLDQPPVGISFDTSGQGELDLQLGKDPMKFGVKIPMDDATKSQATVQVGSDKIGAFQYSFGSQGVGGELSKDSGHLTVKLSLDLGLGSNKVQETVGFHFFSRF
jgi:RHS repeat-associated protein